MKAIWTLIFSPDNSNQGYEMQDNCVAVLRTSQADSLLRSLPISFSAYSLGDNRSLRSKTPVAGQSLRTPEGKPKALVVDDVADVTDMLSIFLGLAGYEVITAHSAVSAIAEAQTQQFDVVISDIGMPQMNGYELAEKLRTLPGYEDVPLVAVTGFSMYDDRERSMQSGFNAHLTKPIDPNVLFQLIERLRS